MFYHFLKFGPLVLLEIAQDGSLEHCLTTNRGKTHGKKLEDLKLSPKLGFLLFSQGYIIFLYILQDSSLRQCLTSSRAETSKKKKKKICGRNDLLYSNVVERPLRLACFNGLLLEDHLESSILLSKVIFVTDYLQPSILSRVIWNRQILAAAPY